MISNTYIYIYVIYIYNTYMISSTGFLTSFKKKIPRYIQKIVRREQLWIIKHSITVNTHITFIFVRTKMISVFWTFWVILYISLVWRQVGH